ncbi:MAG: UbiA-like polyprenyltransferase [Vampirovibrionales bacterium]|nr:UbiA-like polyprenyltransferase [Vampirovibrionales bacterium]
MQWIRKIRLYGELVAFEHTVFALPFALSALLLAASDTRWPDLTTTLWVIACMVSGRTFAMGLNRLLDCHLDAKNPRTQSRVLPSGRLKYPEAWFLTLAAGTLLAWSTTHLPSLCVQLLPIVYAVLILYSFTKRFTSLCHCVLGLALGISAIGGWVALSASLNGGLPVLLGLAIACWVAGFDIIYACQDIDFDRRYGLHSIPAWLGVPTSLALSKGLHILTIVCLIAFGLAYSAFWQPAGGVGWGYWLATSLMGVFLVWQHRLVSACNLSQVNAAFFTANGWASVSFLAALTLERLIRSFLEGLS